MDNVIKHILVPIDFSHNSKAALSYSSDFAGKFNAEIHLLYVIEPIIYAPDFSLGQITMPSVETGDLEKRAYEELQSLANSGIPSSIKSSVTVSIGKPFTEIIDYAKKLNIDLIIISSHGHSSVESILFGSTSEKVVRKAPCPVLTLREPLKGFDYKELL